MKKIILFLFRNQKSIGFLLLFIFSFSCLAQNWAPTGSVWYYSYNNFTVTGYVEIKYIGDSLVNGKMTKMLRKVKYWYDYLTTNSGIDTLGYEFTYLSNDTVYYYRFGQFYKLYIFSANANDYWTIAGWGHPATCDSIGETKVDSIGTTIINSTTLKYLKVSPKDTSDWQFGGTLVERIGCIDYYMFPEPRFCAVDQDEGGALRCYYDSTFGLYQTGNVPTCDFVSSVNSFDKNTNQIKVFPNPFNEFTNIFIDSKINLPVDVTVINLIGAEVQKNSNIRLNSFKVYKESLPSGIYLLKISTPKKEKTFTKKIIVD